MPVNHHLTDAMFLTSFLVFTGAFKAIYAGWAVRDTSPLFHLIITQRRRYTFLGLGQGIITACAVWLLSLGSVHDIIAGTKEWFALGMVGWIVDLAIILIPASLIISTIALISIRRRPAQMAYKCFGRDVYCTTESRRTGSPEFVRPVTLVDPINPSVGTFRDFRPL